MPDVLVVDDEFAVRTLTARWLTTADAFDLLRHPRHLSLPRSVGESLAELNRTRGRDFDPAVLDALAKLVIVN